MKSWKFLPTLALLWATAASAQVITLPKPFPPAVVTPASGATLRGEASARTSLQVTWNHWQVLHTPQQPMPTHFVVCLRPASQMANCSFAPADFVPVGSFQPTRLFSGLVHAGYQYTLSLPLAGMTISDALLDIDLNLSVGACRGPGASTCSFSASSAVFLSARDLRAVNVSSVHTSANAVYQHKFKNEGSTDIPGVPNIPIKVAVNEWQALLNANNQCLLDVNHRDVRLDPNVIVFVVTGDGYWMPDYQRLLAQGATLPKVVGMHRWTGGGNVPGAVLSFGLSLPHSRTGQVDFSFVLPQALRPRGYITYTYVDSTNVVREFDESNNRRAECDVVPADP